MGLEYVWGRFRTFPHLCPFPDKPTTVFRPTKSESDTCPLPGLSCLVGGLCCGLLSFLGTHPSQYVPMLAVLFTYGLTAAGTQGVALIWCNEMIFSKRIAWVNSWYFLFETAFGFVVLLLLFLLPASGIQASLTFVGVWKLISAFAVVAWVPESPRWLLCKGRNREVGMQLGEAAVWSGKLDKVCLFF